MATDWTAIKEASINAAWCASGLFLEGLFWVLLHFISKLAGLVQQGVETFIKIARRPDAVEECWGSHLSIESEDQGFGPTDLGSDHISPPIYGYGPSRMPVKESPGMTGRSKLKLEPTVHHLPSFEHCHEALGGRQPAGGNRKSSTTIQNRKYDCNVLDLTTTSDIPHFLCNFPGHTNRKWYAVAKGRKIGIFKCWEAAEEQVKGFSGLKQQAFRRHAQAEEYFRWKLVDIE